MFQISKLSAAAGARLRRASVIGSTLVGGVLAPVLSAHAALPAGVETAIGTAGTDLVTAGTAVVVAMIGFWAVKAVGRKLGFWA
jgi:hypothetical protein